MTFWACFACIYTNVSSCISIHTVCSSCASSASSCACSCIVANWEELTLTLAWKRISVLVTCNWLLSSNTFRSSRTSWTNSLTSIRVSADHTKLHVRFISIRTCVAFRAHCTWLRCSQTERTDWALVFLSALIIGTVPSSWARSTFSGTTRWISSSVIIIPSYFRTINLGCQRHLCTWACVTGRTSSAAKRWSFNIICSISTISRGSSLRTKLSARAYQLNTYTNQGVVSGTYCLF